MNDSEPIPQRRNKGFDETHLEMIETAVRLISAKGVDALSVSAIAREAGINRTTVYYHFESREALIKAVKDWSAAQIAKAFEPTQSRENRIDYITHFVLDHPELIKLWIDDLLSAGDIRERYAQWDSLVNIIRTVANDPSSAEPIDAEIYCVNLLLIGILGPRVFKNSVDPSLDNDTIVRRFRGEHLRLFRHIGLAGAD